MENLQRYLHQCLVNYTITNGKNYLLALRGAVFADWDSIRLTISPVTIYNTNLTNLESLIVLTLTNCLELLESDLRAELLYTYNWTEIPPAYQTPDLPPDEFIWEDNGTIHHLSFSFFCSWEEFGIHKLVINFDPAPSNELAAKYMIYSSYMAMRSILQSRGES